jgi:hypothetical protein
MSKRCSTDRGARTGRPRRAYTQCTLRSAPKLLEGDGDQVANETKKIAKVITEADPFDGVFADALALLLCQPGRAADPGVTPVIFRKRRGNDTLANLGLNKHVRVAVWRTSVGNPSDVKRGVRPIRLRQIFDYARNMAVPLDQQNIPGELSPNVGDGRDQAAAV